MRTASLLPFLLMLGCAGALESTTGRPNAVEVSTGLAPGEAYSAAAGAVLEAGYALGFSDDALHTFTTEARESGPVNVAVSVRVRDDGVAIFRGTYTVPGVDSTPAPVVRYGMGGSPAMRAWDALETVAGRLPGERRAVVE
jgi:hypothetical protein